MDKSAYLKSQFKFNYSTYGDINYAFIFEMNPRWKLLADDCFGAVTSLTLMWLLAIGSYPRYHIFQDFFFELWYVYVDSFWNVSIATSAS